MAVTTAPAATASGLRKTAITDMPTAATTAATATRIITSRPIVRLIKMVTRAATTMAAEITGVAGTGKF